MLLINSFHLISNLCSDMNIAVATKKSFYQRSFDWCRYQSVNDCGTTETHSVVLI